MNDGFFDSFTLTPSSSPLPSESTEPEFFLLGGETLGLL